MNTGMNQICEDLRRIVRLQKHAVREELTDEFCSARKLHCGRRNLCNTRPLQIFTDDDKAWSIPIHRNEDGCENMEKSCVFRVEKVDGGTATFRALIPVGEFDGEEGCERNRKYIPTDSFITIKLNCICAIRCLNDVFVDLCIRNPL